MGKPLGESECRKGQTREVKKVTPSVNSGKGMRYSQYEDCWRRDEEAG